MWGPVSLFEKFWDQKRTNWKLETYFHEKQSRGTKTINEIFMGLH